MNRYILDDPVLGISEAEQRINDVCRKNGWSLHSLSVKTIVPEGVCWLIVYDSRRTTTPTPTASLFR